MFQVSIFMTHMTNYANDRLAPYLFKKLVKFVQRWTNLKLMSATPKQLADIYFEIFPDEITPVWQVSSALPPKHGKWSTACIRRISSSV